MLDAGCWMLDKMASVKCQVKPPPLTLTAPPLTPPHSGRGNDPEGEGKIR